MRSCAEIKSRNPCKSGGHCPGVKCDCAQTQFRHVNIGRNILEKTFEMEH
jgi:hypothetical protein